MLERTILTDVLWGLKMTTTTRTVLAHCYTPWSCEKFLYVTSRSPYKCNCAILSIFFLLHVFAKCTHSYRKRSSQMGRFHVVLIKPRSDNNSVITWQKVIVTVVGSTGKFDLNSARPPTCFTTLPSSSMRITRTPSLTNTCDTGKRIYRVNDEGFFRQGRQDQPCNSNISRGDLSFV